MSPRLQFYRLCFTFMVVAAGNLGNCDFIELATLTLGSAGARPRPEQVQRRWERRRRSAWALGSWPQ